MAGKTSTRKPTTDAAGAGKKKPAGKSVRHGPDRSAATAGGKLAQVRLRPDEIETLRQVMDTLDLESVSEALREGLRLLGREAAEVAAAHEIREFYGGEPAPLPEGVPAATEAELAAADAIEW